MEHERCGGHGHTYRGDVGGGYMGGEVGGHEGGYGLAHLREVKGDSKEF